MAIEVLTGHVSPDTAYVVDDYPYGFTLRCKIRYWIETTKHGQRVVSQTTNPKRTDREVWNTPKASTYSNVRVLFLNDENGHVENNALSFYATSAQIAGFEQEYGAGLTSERDQRELRVLKANAAVSERRAAARHRAADPHCTCPDCILHHSQQMEGK